MAEFILRETLRDKTLINRIGKAIVAQECEIHGIGAMKNKHRIMTAVEEVAEALYLNAPVRDIPTEEELHGSLG